VGSHSWLQPAFVPAARGRAQREEPPVLTPL
jgi:hypothetical protein